MNRITFTIKTSLIAVGLSHVTLLNGPLFKKAYGMEAAEEVLEPCKVSTLSPSQDCVDLIKHFEGFESKSYTCPGGHATIGYGHLIKQSESYTEVSREEAEDILRADMQTAVQGVQKQVTVPLFQYQFDALVSFTFNLGTGNLSRSTLLKIVNAGLHTDVPTELNRWVKAGGKTLPGLVRRRGVEGVLYATGILRGVNG